MAFLEDYTLLDVLGQGGFATVYKVRHNKLGYIRAIRVLNAIIARGEEDETYKKFLQECILLLRLGNGSHPNIVHIYQPLLKAQRAIVEMDYVDGKDLFHFLKDHNFYIEIKDVLKLLTDIGSALAYCHEDIYKYCMDKDEDDLKDDPNDGTKVLLDEKTKKRLIKKYRVIHNDIHSGNIIRREDGSYVLLDFGLAIEGESVIRSSRRKNGAPEFKAPEKWDNESDLSTQSDIYSFGVVLYEFLAGRVPFVFDKKNSNAIEAEYLLGKAHKEQEPEPIFELRKVAYENSHPGVIYKKDYPDWLELLIMKCLSKSVKDRFENGKALYDFILEHINNETIIPAPFIKEEIDALEQQINELKNKNEKQKTTIDERNTEINSLKQKISDLEEKLSNLNLIPDKGRKDFELKIKTLNDELDKLKIENERLIERSKNKVSKIWAFLFIISLIPIGLFTSIVLSDNPEKPGISNAYIERDSLLELLKENPNSPDVIKLRNEIKAKNDRITDLSNQIGMLNSKIRSLESTGGDEAALKKEIIEKDSKISERTESIKALKSENEKLKNSNDDSDFQSVITERDNSIRQLNTQISNLRKQIQDKDNQIKEKDKLISILNEQIGVN